MILVKASSTTRFRVPRNGPGNFQAPARSSRKRVIFLKEEISLGMLNLLLSVDSTIISEAKIINRSPETFAPKFYIGPGDIKLLKYMGL
jgi:hypothetical protein